MQSLRHIPPHAAPPPADEAAFLRERLRFAMGWIGAILEPYDDDPDEGDAPWPPQAA